MKNIVANWKTTLWGAIGGTVLVANGILQAHASGQAITWGSIEQIALGVVLAALGLSAKDHNVTGGTTQQ